ncbi:MAG TPA: hypothetical protein ENK18_27190 [Deltaproteobacteria bacterium]|nr:hypothetical protein [Deltaproteobacteria bacterium]
MIGSFDTVWRARAARAARLLLPGGLALWASVPLGLYASALALGAPGVWGPLAGGAPARGLGWAFPLALGPYLLVVGQPAPWRRLIRELRGDTLRASLALSIPTLISWLLIVGLPVLHPAAIGALALGSLGAWGLAGARWIRARGGAPLDTWRLGWRLGWRCGAASALLAVGLGSIGGVGLVLSGWPALALAELIAEPELFSALGALPWAGILGAALPLHQDLVGILGIAGAVAWVSIAGLILPGRVLLSCQARRLLVRP